MNAHLVSPQFEQDLREVVEGIFSNMFDLPLALECDRIDLSGEHLKAVVEFTGSWMGQVEISCSKEQACHFAERFLALSANEVGDRLISDVLMEIANMVAGNLKSVFANDIRLSTPIVTHGVAHTLSFTPDIERELFFSESNGARFCITVLAAQTVPSSACD